MNNFNKKQKMILGIITVIITGFICYYVYAENDYNTQLEDNLEIQNEELNTQEKENDDKILVHISGAIKREGIVELKENSRISDAINEARRSNRRCIHQRHQFSI